MSYTRPCPNCGIEKQYATESSRLKAENKGSVCRKCAALASGFIERYSTSGNCLGSNNPFYGKKHQAETIDKFKEVDKSIYQTDEFRNKMSSVVAKGDKCYFYKTSTCQALINKHGNVLGKELFEEHRKKLSIAMSGKGNHMYGKPSPQGSGNGWSGWHKGHFFRSLRELSYMIRFLKDRQWVSAETSGFSIDFVDWTGECRTYHPDFLVENKWLVEVKPTRLHNTPLVKLKADAAINFCKDKGWEYQLVDPGQLTTEEIKELHDSEQIKFTDRYEKLYNERTLTETSPRGDIDAS